MSRVVRAALIQAHANLPKEEALAKHVAMVEQAAGEVRRSPACRRSSSAPTSARSRSRTGSRPPSPTTAPRSRRCASSLGSTSWCSSSRSSRESSRASSTTTAVVIDADGSVLGTYRKTHIPQVGPIFWEKYFFKPGNLGYPVFDTRVGRVGVFICYDRHFPEPARMLGLHGAQITFNPSATIESLSRYMWELEQPAHAVASGYFVGAINRVGEELVPGARFYGSSYFCDPRGQIMPRHPTPRTRCSSPTSTWR